MHLSHDLVNFMNRYRRYSVLTDGIKSQNISKYKYVSYLRH